MENVKARSYKNNKHINYKENKDILSTEDNNVDKGFNGLTEELLEEVIILFNEKSINVKTDDIAISSKITASHEIKHSKNHINNKYAIISILKDSWTLAEGLGKKVSHTHIVGGLAYCSSYNFD